MPSARHSNTSRSRFTLRWPHFVAAGIALVALLIAIGAIAERNWPYRYRNVKPTLEETFASQITIKRYHRVYLPRPGFVAEGLTLQRRSNDPQLPPLGSAQEIRVEGGWLDLLMLRKHIELVEVRGMTVSLPPANSQQLREDFPQGSAADFAGPTTTIGTMRVHDSTFEVQRDGQEPLRYPVHLLIVRNLARGRPAAWDVDMENAVPAGHLRARGSFGPTVTQDLGQTKLSGDFTLDNVQLQTTGALRGALGASGRFDGTLGNVSVTASTDTPQFSVADGRPIDLKADVRAVVDGIHGNVRLDAVDAMLGQTKIHATGNIAGGPKAVAVDATVPHGRVQDLMQPFMQDRPSLRGPIALRVHAKVPGTKSNEPFLHRLIAEASFDAPAETFANKDKQQQLSDLSHRETHAPDGDTTEVMSSLRGPLSVHNGVVTVPKLVFTAPGVSVEAHGTYTFDHKTLRLTGDANLQSSLSQATTGWKSWLLKPFNPFFKRKHQDAGAVVPIAITGANGNYTVSQNILHDK